MRAKKMMNSLAAVLWKYPKWLTSVALARTTESDCPDEEASPEPAHFITRSAVIFMVANLVGALFEKEKISDAKTTENFSGQEGLPRVPRTRREY